MDWKMVWLTVCVVALLGVTFAAGFYLKEGQVTARVVQEEQEAEHEFYSSTTALCGNNNACIDITVVCNGSQIVSVTPSSDLVFHRPEWEDPRGGNPVLCARDIE